MENERTFGRHGSQEAEAALLVKASLSGSSTAFAKLVSMHHKRVWAVGMSFFHNKSDTEDFVQEVFLKAYTHLSSFQAKSSFATWLTSIAYTTAINAKNRAKEYDTLADEELLESNTHSPEENHIRNATREAVREAVKELPEAYAFCIDLYFFYDSSYEEIAKITSLPLNTIKSHIFRAKKILRTKLAEYS